MKKESALLLLAVHSTLPTRVDHREIYLLDFNCVFGLGSMTFFFKDSPGTSTCIKAAKPTGFRPLSLEGIPELQKRGNNLRCGFPVGLFSPLPLAKRKERGVKLLFAKLIDLQDNSHTLSRLCERIN